MAYALSSLFVAVACSTLATPMRAQSALVGVTYDGNTVSINTTTGSGGVIALNGVLGLNALAIDPQGRLLAAGFPTFGPPKMYFIEPVLGGAVVAYLPFLNDIRALAFSPAGVLYGIDNGPSGSLSNLYVFDLSVPYGSSRIRQLVGPVTILNSSAGVQGLAFAPDGSLYGWAIGWGLVTIDPATGHAIDVNGLLDGDSSVQTLAFAPDGTLYGAYDNLYTLDRITGGVTLVGGPIASGDVRGMEFLPDVPRIYCTSKTNPLNCTPQISFQGTPSASAGSGFIMSAGNFINRKIGGFCYSIHGGVALHWGNGFLCELSPIRCPQLFTGGNPLPTVDCSGVLTFDFNTYVATVGPAGVLAGTTIWGQFLSRDPLDPIHLDMSDAITFTVGP